MQQGALTVEAAAVGNGRSRAAVAEPDPMPRGGRRDRRSLLLVLLVAGIAASPVIVAAVSLAAEPWYPVGDVAHMVFRTSQVGTADTPLVGAYTVKGWAHPGPLLFWLSAPLYRLLGEDPRAVEWTTAIVNVVCIVALARVAWRRGGLPLLLTLGTFTALLVHGFSPELMVSAWNPFVPLLPFLLTVVLVWDAALGRRRAMVEALIPASIAMQGHVAFAALVAVLCVWLYGWCRWWPRLLPAEADNEAGETPAPSDGDELPRPPWNPWYGALRRGALVVGVLWAGPLLDTVVDLHNPLTIVKSLATPPAAVGPLNAVGLVGRYVRPDGPWLGGAEPQSLNLDVQGSGPVPFLIALLVLGLCVHVARQRRLLDVLALSTLALALLVGSIPATSQIVLPAFHYLTQWLKITGSLVWLTAAWTAWRVAEPHVRISITRQKVAAGLATAVLVVAVAVSWPEARAVEQPSQRESPAVQDLRAQLADTLPRDSRIRMEIRGDFLAISGPGLVYWLIHDGHDLVTSDGWMGLKWGHEHRWSRGDDADLLLTFALDKAVDQCNGDPRARMLAGYDAMSPADRAWYSDMQLRRLADADVTDEELHRADRLAVDDLRMAVFAGPRICAEDPEWEVVRSTDASVAPVLGGAAAAVVAAGGFLLLRRRRRPTPTG